MKQFLRFIVVGVLNTISGLSIIFACKAFFAWGDVPANATGYSVGLLISFFLNKSWTFNHEGAYAGVAIKFLATFAIAYSLNLATVLVLIEQVGVNDYLAHFFGMMPYTLSFFVLSRYYVFR